MGPPAYNSGYLVRSIIHLAHVPVSVSFSVHESELSRIPNWRALCSGSFLASQPVSHFSR